MSDSIAAFITSSEVRDAAPLFRRIVTLDRPHRQLAAASIELSATGLVEGWIGGVPISDELLVPGWSSFEWRLRSVRHDVTSHITTDRFVMGFTLGRGWYGGRLGWQAGTRPYGTELGLFVRLHLRYTDGHEQLIVSAGDNTWTAGPSEIISNDLYDGESIDARAIPKGWENPGFTDLRWRGVHEIYVDPALLEPAIAPPVRRVDEVLPHKIWSSPSGKTLVDFGQNLVGFIRVNATGNRDEVISVRHAEVLENGEIATRPLRSALATDRFILSGDDDTFEPTFTFHGFRYAEVSGWPGGIEAIREGALTAVVVASDVRRTGWLETSDSLLNTLHENVVRGMRGNFVGIPADCPQRDERLGWTGDIAVFAPTAAYIGDVKDFLRDWLRDLALEQTHSGFVPLVVPDILKYMPSHPFPTARSVAFWSDAAVWVPWALWQAYGDIEVLRESFPSMLSHIRRVEGELSPDGVWETGLQLGDWLDPDADPHRPDDAKADKSVVATAAAYRSASIVAEAAAVLREDGERSSLAALALRIREGFSLRYVSGTRVKSDCTTVYALAIAFGLLDATERESAGLRLAQLVEADGFRISTGFAGTPYILDALSSTGHVEAAYSLLQQTECPSWLYPVTMGATTVWERWDSMRPDGTINPGEMTSFNHYALGAVADWMHRTIGGIAPLAPGYARVLIEPRPGGTLHAAHARLNTPRGEVSVAWEIVAHEFLLTVGLPDGIPALVRLPDRSEYEVRGGQSNFSCTLVDNEVRTVSA